MKKLSLVLCLMLLISTFVGCTQQSVEQPKAEPEAATEVETATETVEEPAGEVEIKYWYWADNSDYSAVMQDIVKKFNESNGKGITVVAEEYPYDNGAYIQNMMTAVLGGGGPDVACFKMDSVPLYSANDLLVDMKPYVDAWADKGEVDDGIWNTIDEVSGEGKVSVIPFAVDVPYCYYRPSMFAEAGLEVPTTFEEFLNCVKTLTKDTDGDGNTDVYGYGLRGSGGHAIWASFAYARGGGMDNLISEGSIQAMQDVIDLYEGGYIPASSTTDGFNEIIGNFKAGITAMTVHHIGSSNEMMELFGDDVAAFIIPGDKPEYTWAQMGETSNVILSNCEHPEAAFEWIAYLTTGEGQYIWNTAGGKLTVATSLRSDEAFSNPFYQASFDALAHTGVLPMLDTLDAFVSDAFPNNLQAALLGTETAEEACQNLQDCLYGE